MRRVTLISSLLLPCLSYDLPFIMHPDDISSQDDWRGFETLVMLSIDENDPRPASEALGNLFSLPSGSDIDNTVMRMPRDSAEARRGARRDACWGSPIWEAVPVAATNSYSVAGRAAHFRSRRGDSALTLRQVSHYDGFFQLARDMGLNGTWVEIGVCQGKTSVKTLDHGPQSLLLLVDLWDAIDGYTKQDGENNLAATLRNLEGYDPASYRIMKMTTSEAADMVEDGSLDFIYLDAGHMYIDVKEDLRKWWPKLKPGGLFAGDDYYNGYVHQAGYTFGVRDAVDEFFSDLNHRIYATDFANAAEGVLQQWYVLKCST